MVATIITIDPVLQTAIFLALALLFSFSAVHKLLNITEFRRALTAYELLPIWSLRWSSIVIPFVEGALSACLFFWQTEALVVAACILILYAWIMAIALLEGKRSIDCGCNFGGTEQPISMLLILRNLIVAVISGLAILPQSERILGLYDLGCIGFILLSAAIFWAAANQLIGNGSFQHRLRS